jgi:hypothetical protein
MAMGTSTMALASLAGAKIETDPRSADFGKIRIGDTRIDIWTGYLQFARFASQFTTGQRKTLASQDVINAERYDTFLRMLQSKSSPISGILIDLMKGETYIGEPMFEGGEETLYRELRDRLTPLFIQDMLDALEADGYFGFFPASTGFFGLGVTSFEKEIPKGGINPYLPNGGSKNPYLPNGKKKNPYLP